MTKESDIEVLPADDTNGVKLNWVVHEKIGVPIYQYLIDDTSKDFETTIGKDGLEIGMKVLVPGLMGGYHLMTVVTGKLAEDKFTAATLFYDEEDGFWRCGGLINKRGVAKGRKETKVGL